MGPVDLTIAYDLETTGLSVLEDAIVQIAAVVVSARRDGTDDNDETGSGKSFMEWVHPGSRRMNPYASKVTGITDKFLENKDCFPVVWKRFMKFLEEAAAPGTIRTLKLVGHNSRTFDDLLLVAAMERYDVTLPDPFGGLMSYAATPSWQRRRPLGAASKQERRTESWLPYTKSAVAWN